MYKDENGVCAHALYLCDYGTEARSPGLAYLQSHSVANPTRGTALIATEMLLSTQ